MQRINTGERASAANAQHAAVGIALMQREDANAIGQYNAVLRALKPNEHKHGTEVFRRMVHLRSQVDRRLRARPTPAMLSVMRRDLDELQALQREIDPLYEDVKTLRAPNVVTTQGKNVALDAYLAGSAYTAAWFMLLISSVSFAAVAAGDTAAAHAGWLEAGGATAPTYSGNRKTAAWSAASAGAKALSAGLVFTFTGAGTVKGCGLATVNTVDSTSGSLYSAGLFTGGDQPVVATNTLTVTYTASL